MTRRAITHIRGLTALVLARLREFRREPSAFFFVLFMPILWMMILGPAFSTHVPESSYIGIDIQSGDPSLGFDVRKALKESSSLKLVEDTRDKLLSDMKRGHIQVLVGFGQQNMVTFEFDPMSREGHRARDLTNNAIQAAAGRKDPVIVRDIALQGPGSRYVDFLVPGLLAVSILSTSIWGVGMTIVSNRKENLLKRLLATPMRSYDYILSHVIGRSVILMVEVCSQLLAAYLLFRFHLSGSFAVYILFALLGAGTLTSLGIFLGARLANTGAMNGIANLISLPMMLLSGAWFSRNHLPDWLEPITDFLPLTPLVDGLRKIALEGAGFQDLQVETSLLAAYFAVFSVLAARLFRWYD